MESFRTARENPVVRDPDLDRVDRALQVEIVVEIIVSHVPEAAT